MRTKDLIALCRKAPDDAASKGDFVSYLSALLGEKRNFMAPMQLERLTEVIEEIHGPPPSTISYEAYSPALLAQVGQALYDDSFSERASQTPNHNSIDNIITDPLSREAATGAYLVGYAHMIDTQHKDVIPTVAHYSIAARHHYFRKKLVRKAEAMLDAKRPRRAMLLASALYLAAAPESADEQCALDLWKRSEEYLPLFDPNPESALYLFEHFVRDSSSAQMGSQPKAKGDIVNAALKDTLFKTHPMNVS